MNMVNKSGLNCLKSININDIILTMNALNKFFRSVKVLVLTFAFLLCFLSSTPMADAQEICVKQGPISITNGSFSYAKTNKNGPAFTVRSAIVSLPDGETGDLNSIIITGPDGIREFGCGSIKYPIKVKNGTNLIGACGGTAVLKAGSTTYAAKGSNFGPSNAINNFEIKLCNDFQ